MRRYQVRSGPRRPWTEPGPDLLRTAPDAIARVMELTPRGTVSVRRSSGSSWRAWRRIGRRRALRRELPDLLRSLGDRQRLQVEVAGRVVAEVRAHIIVVRNYPGATPRAEIVQALFERAHPASEFAGIYACRRVNGSSDPRDPWSVHAWGDAADRTPAPGRNDELSDWAARMARAGLMPAVQVLGSRNDREVEWRKVPLLGWRGPTPYTGTGSHLWHVHVTCRWHTGTPPCAKGR